MKPVVLENGYFLPNDGSGRLLAGEMRIEGGRITRLGKPGKKTKSEKRINLKGQLVIPGFVQTHVHLCQTLFRNLADDLQLLDWLKLRIWPMEGAHTQSSLHASARLGIAELLAGGTTTILDMGTVRHTDAIFAAAAEMGIRAFMGKCLMDRDDNPRELRESTAAALKENLRLLDYWHGRENGRLQYAHAPRFLLSASEKLLTEIKALADDRKNIVHTHSSENRAEVEAVRKLYKCENVEAFHRLGLTSERLVLAHCIHLNAREERILASSGTRVSHCPSSNLKLASGVCRVPELKAKGISVSLGADGAPCNNNLNMFQEMRLASLLQKPIHGPTAMGAQEVFEMATIDGAKALGIGGDVGSLEPGKKADFAIINFQAAAVSTELDVRHPDRAYSALVYSCGPANVTETWVDGRSVFKNGSFGGAPQEKIVETALRERKKLLARI